MTTLEQIKQFKSGILDAGHFELGPGDRRPSSADAGNRAAESRSSYQWGTRPGLSRRALERALAYIENNIGTNFTLDELAGAAFLSRSHFSRLFRQSTGESPMACSLRLRIEHAKEMLLKEDLKTSEIALMLAFFDQSHFCRSFRRATGLSPREYVRMHDVAQAAE